MITEQNKWAIIEAYLTGLLDEPGRQAVAEKMTVDAQFRADVLMHYTLHQQLDQHQTEQDYALIDRLLQEVPPSPIPLNKSTPPQSIWNQTWIRAVAMLVFVAGVSWIGYKYWATPAAITGQIPYEQRGFGINGIPQTKRLTTFPVIFSNDGPSGGQYSSSPTELHVFLTSLPGDIRQWRLLDDPQQGGFLLVNPQHRTYRLDRDTYGQRKSLPEVR